MSVRRLARYLRWLFRARSFAASARRLRRLCADERHISPDILHRRHDLYDLGWDFDYAAAQRFLPLGGPRAEDAEIEGDGGA